MLHLWLSFLQPVAGYALLAVLGFTLGWFSHRSHVYRIIRRRTVDRRIQPIPYRQASALGDSNRGSPR
jgi:hypothetical protein